jgi:hypothetical protein
MIRSMTRMRTLPLLVRTVLHAFGVRGLVRRLAYEAQLRTGILARRLPVADGYDHLTPVIWHHRFDLAAIRAGYTALPDAAGLTERLRADVARLLAGHQTLYGALEVEAGWPPRWDTDPLSGTRWPRAHWTAVPDDAPLIGDIKDVWELSRLPVTYLLARAYAATGDESYPEAWWTMLEDWMAENPPNLGVNWRCGQETSLRAIAVQFGLSTFDECRASTPERVAAAGRLLAASVARVRPTVGYALSQRNNHAVSELVLLLTLDGPRRRWCRPLTEVLEDQWYPDGSYGQQSANYQRLAVQALQWLLTVRDDLPADLITHIRDVLARSAAFLARTSDPVSGTLSNMGANDGAHLLPLSGCEHHDVRPLLASLGMTTGAPAAAEQALWVTTPVDVPDLSDVPSAWPSLTVGGVHVLMHAGASRHRAGHADQLAVEVYVEGQPVLIDPGSYRYSGTAPWRNPFTGPDAHSAIIGTHEGRERFGRFLAPPQSAAEVIGTGDGASSAWLVARRDTERGSVLWRSIVAQPTGLLLLDATEHGPARVQHALAVLQGIPRPEVALSVESGVLRGPREREADAPSSGWWSPNYATRSPSTVLAVDLDLGGATVLALGDLGDVTELTTALLDLAPQPAAASWTRMVRELCSGATGVPPQ